MNIIKNSTKIERHQTDATKFDSQFPFCTQNHDQKVLHFNLFNHFNSIALKIKSI